MISREIRQLLESGSAIRNVWSLGHRLKQAHGAANVADMTLGNPVAPPPEALLRALEEVVRNPPDGLHRYTPNAGHPEVRERVAAHLDGHGILPGVEHGHVVLTAGASAASNVLLRAVLEPGDEVVILAPHFPDYPAHVLNYGGVPVTVPTARDFLPDCEAVERVLGDRTRVVILNHPNNPTGRQYPEEVLRELGGLLQAAGRRSGRTIYLLSDEPYREIRYTPEPFVSPARVYEHGVMAYSFSKSHSIPGERVGYLAVNPESSAATELVRGLTLANRILGFTNTSSIWQHVMARCLDSLIDLAPLRRHRDRLVETLVRKGYEVTAPDGTFYLFPRTPGGDDDAFVQAAMNDLLLLVPGGAFGGPGYFRLAFCVDDHTVDLAVERLPEAASVEGRSAAGGSR